MTGQLSIYSQNKYLYVNISLTSARPNYPSLKSHQGHFWTKSNFGTVLHHHLVYIVESRSYCKTSQEARSTVKLSPQCVDNQQWQKIFRTTRWLVYTRLYLGFFLSQMCVNGKENEKSATFVHYFTHYF